MSVGNISKIASGFRITAPAQPSATGLPCIRPCLTWSLGLLQLSLGDQNLGLGLSGTDSFHKCCDLLSLRPEPWTWKVRSDFWWVGSGLRGLSDQYNGYQD